MKSAVFAPCS